MTDETKIQDSRTALCFGLALLCPMIYTSAAVLSTLWRWFAVPIFDAPTINTPNAAGLMCLLAALKGIKSGDDKDEPFTWSTVGDCFRAWLVRVIIVFVPAWIAHFYA